MIRPHLTDDQFAEILIKGSVTHEIEDHLAKCASCRDELGVFSETVGDFRNVSLRWMEARPATSLRQAAHESARRVTYLKYGWAAAAAVLLAVPVWTYSHRSVSMNQHQTAAMQRDEQEPIADSETQIAKDNELLQAVNLALADSEPPELREYGIVSDRRTRVALRPEWRNE